MIIGLKVVMWSDIIGDMDDENISWPFDLGQAAYTIITRQVVLEELEAYLGSLESDVADIDSDEGEDNGLEDIQNEVLAVKAVIATLTKLADGVLVAFDG